MNWLYQLFKRSQVWQSPEHTGYEEDYFAAEVKELYRLSYLYFGIQDRIRNTGN